MGVTFLLPSFQMVLALGWACVEYGGITGMQAVFYGVGASAIGIITISAYKLTQKTIGKNRLMWAIYLASAATTIYTESELKGESIQWEAEQIYATDSESLRQQFMEPVEAEYRAILAALRKRDQSLKISFS